MEIFTLLEAIEELLGESKKMPFSNKHIVDKEEILDIVKEIKSSILEMEGEKAHNRTRFWTD